MDTTDEKRTNCDNKPQETTVNTATFFSDVFKGLSEGRQRQQDMRKRFEERRKKLGYTPTR